MRFPGPKRMPPRRKTGALAACFLLLALCAWVPAARAEGRLVRVGVYENAPKIFTAESGRPAGIFIDIIEYIAQREGWRLQYVPGAWGQGLDRLQKGAIDLMPDVAYTSNRAEIFAFHKAPVLSSWFQVYGPRGSGIQSILDLNGKRVAVLERSVQQAAFMELSSGFGLDVTLVTLPDYQAVFEKVASGEVDAAISNRFYGLMHAKKYGIEETSVIFNPTNLFYAAPLRGPPELLAALDAHLRELKNDPQSIYYASIKRWISEEPRFRLPGWVPVLGLVAGVALLMSLTGSVILRRQVNARTRELVETNLAIEKRIEERTAELAVAMERAQEADRLKSSFLATMSHELRTPLNSIIGFTGIMLQGLAGPLNGEQQKQMGMVANSARHLLSLINDVLDISKIEAGQLDLHLEPCELRPSLEKALRLVAPLAEKKGISLEMACAEGIGAARLDRRRLEQIILNLLNNAVKFTDTGGVRLACQAKDGQIVISVSDTGIGMEPGEIEKIFSPFHQIDNGLTRRHEGTGLGLSICKKLAEMMEGSIGVESQPGRGSVFYLHLPQKQEDHDEPQAADH